MTIRHRLVATVLAAVILPIAIVAVLAVSEFRALAESNFRENAQRQMQQVSQIFDTYLTGMEHSVEFLSQTDAIRGLDSSVVNYFAADAQMTPEQNSAVERRAWRLMDDFGNSNPDLAYVYLGLEDGGYIQWPVTALSEYDPRKRPWYGAALDKPGQAVSASPYLDIVTGDPVLPHMHSFTTESGMTGVVAMDITLGKLTQIVRGVTFSETGYLIMIDQSGVVLADAGQPDNNFKQIGDISSDYAAMARGDLDYIELNGDQWLVSRFQSDKSGWTLVGVVPSSEVFATANTFQMDILLVGVGVLLIFSVLGFWLAGRISSPIAAMTHSMEEIANGEGDLTRRLPEKGNDELSEMAQSFNRFVAMIHQLVRDISETSVNVRRESGNGASIAASMANSSQRQSDAITQVTVAFNEMVATSMDVARSCNETAGAAEQSQEQVVNGQTFISNTVSAVTALTDGIQHSNQAMKQLAEETRNITAILDTIRGIAEQTNLLALNAAIEAARAGEQGRGFAVVADEVRTLAGRTAESTAEIDNMIISLTQQTDEVAKRLENTLQHSDNTLSATDQTRDAFAAIQDSVSCIRDMTQQIAAAAEEQQQVSEEINRHIVEVSEEADSARESAGQLNLGASGLSEMSERLGNTVSRFRV